MLALKSLIRNLKNELHMSIPINGGIKSAAAINDGWAISWGHTDHAPRMGRDEIGIGVEDLVISWRVGGVSESVWEEGDDIDLLQWGWVSADGVGLVCDGDLAAVGGGWDFEVDEDELTGRNRD
jgi:hypothetical protein